MNSKFLALSVLLNQLVPDVTARREVATMAFSLAVARRQMLPTLPVDVPETYLRNTHYINIRNEISELNEAVVFDVTTAIENLVPCFWYQRYFMLYPNVLPEHRLKLLEGCDFFGQVTGAGLNMSQKQLAFASTWGNQIVRLANATQAAMTPEA